MSHTWVYHPAIGQHWLCPEGSLQDQIALGWQPCQAPPEPNPAVAERIAFEREMAAAAADTQPEAEPEPTSAADRGEIEE